MAAPPAGRVTAPILPVAILAVTSGLPIGLSLGALGGGGSILAVPALVYLLGLPVRQATTVSLIVVGIAAVAGAVTHARAGRVRLKEGAVLGMLGIAGSYAGSLASAAVPADVLLAGFAALMFAVAAVMTIRRRAAVAVPAASAGGAGSGPAGSVPAGSVPAGSGPAGSGAAARLSAANGRGLPLVAAVATVVGLITGFFGVGGGFVIVPALVLLLGFDMPAAAGTSLAVIAIDSAAALAARLGSGSVHVAAVPVVAFAAAAIAGTLAGGRVAGRVSATRLSVAFTVLVVLAGGYTLARALPGLS